METTVSKREKFQKAKESVTNLAQGGYYRKDKVFNIKTLFIVESSSVSVLGDDVYDSVLRDFVYDMRRRSDFELSFELLDCYCGYFAGNKETAESLHAEYGGKIFHDYDNIWVWEHPNRKLLPKSQLVDFDEACELLNM